MSAVHEDYWVILFEAVSYALKAEKILKEAGLPYKLIPVPRHISSDCGVCLRFHADLRAEIIARLADKVEMEQVRRLAD
jgi:hypothetical protein